MINLERTLCPLAVLLVGIPASGKSTFYRQILKPRGFVHINLDTLGTRRRESDLLDACISSRRSFAVDNTNTLRQERSAYIAAARNAGFMVVGYFLRSWVAECIERNEQRGLPVPRVAVAAMSARLELPSYAEGFDALYYVSISENGFEVQEWEENV